MKNWKRELAYKKMPKEVKHWINSHKNKLGLRELARKGAEKFPEMEFIAGNQAEALDMIRRAEIEE